MSLASFAEDAASAYRLNFWSGQPDYIEFFVEKVGYSSFAKTKNHGNVIRGQVSETFAWTIAEEWKEIEKPIYAYYLGDHDPAGLKIEASLKSKLQHFAGKEFCWQRLAITEEDFADKRLLGFNVKRKGPRRSWQPYIDEHGDRCVEVPPDDIRGRVKNVIELRIDGMEWEKLRETERLERETWKKITEAIAA